MKIIVHITRNNAQCTWCLLITWSTPWPSATSAACLPPSSSSSWCPPPCPSWRPSPGPASAAPRTRTRGPRTLWRWWCQLLNFFRQSDTDQIVVVDIAGSLNFTTFFDIIFGGFSFSCNFLFVSFLTVNIFLQNIWYGYQKCRRGCNNGIYIIFSLNHWMNVCNDVTCLTWFNDTIK